MTPTTQTLPKWVLINGNWIERPYVLTKSPQGLSDAPANSTKEQDNG